MGSGHGCNKKGERTDTTSDSQVRPRCWTIGHSTLTLEAFLELLGGCRIDQLADIRRYPASQLHPHFNRETLATVLDARGIEYRWFESLGGRRVGVPERESINRGLTNPGFRHYADYMLTGEFRRALDDLVMWLETGRTALMCAEALWWRCHRRLVSDRLVAEGVEVSNILSDGKTEPHAMWDLAVRSPKGLVYPPEQGELKL